MGLLGIFGPKLVIFLVWKQYLSAKDVVQRSQKQAHIEEDTGLEERVEKHMATVKLSPVVHGNHSDAETISDSMQNILSSPDSPAPPWSLAHGFYAGMGGFTFPSSSLRADSGRLTFTTQGVALLAECELLPDIEREDILDKVSPMACRNS